MKKFVSAFLAGLLTAGCLSGCANTKTAEPSNKVVLGGNGPLTGNYATYGISERNGAMLAALEINAAGGVNGLQLEICFEDNEADPTKALSSYAILMDAGMNVSLGGTTSGCTVAVSEEARKDGILMLTPSGSQKDCTKYDNCFRVCYMDPDLGR